MTKPTTIRVLRKRPRQRATVETIPNTLKDMQGLLDGAYLESVPLHATHMHLYVDENGLELTFNMRINGHDLHGPLVISKCDSEGCEIGLTAEEIAFLKARLDEADDWYEKHGISYGMRF